MGADRGAGSAVRVGLRHGVRGAVAGLRLRGAACWRRGFRSGSSICTGGNCDAPGACACVVIGIAAASATELIDSSAALQAPACRERGALIARISPPRTATTALALRETSQPACIVAYRR